MRAGSYVSLRDLDMTTKRAELSGIKVWYVPMVEYYLTL